MEWIGFVNAMKGGNRALLIYHQ